MSRIVSYLILCFLIIQSVRAYRPVVLIHGIMTGGESMVLIEEEIRRKHEGTIVYNLDRYGGWSSLENAWRQIQVFGEDLANICSKHPEGVNLLGYSQGGLLARVLVQYLENHNVKTLVSLSSPQAGQFGTDFLHLIFPQLIAKTAYQLFYSYVGQHTAVGNYWNDPHHQDLYQQFSIFLPYVNNEIISTNSSQFRDNLLKLEKMVLIGGPQDGVITPWQSSHFGYYDQNDTVIPFKERKIYTEDRIGLQTLEKSGKLKVVVVPGVQHFAWHLNLTVINKWILPFLD